MKTRKIEITKENWEQIYEIVSRNPIVFIEHFWNIAYPDQEINLNDNEKQEYFDKYKGIPLISMDKFSDYLKHHEERKDRNIKDWEIF